MKNYIGVLSLLCLILLTSCQPNEKADSTDEAVQEVTANEEPQRYCYEVRKDQTHIVLDFTDKAGKLTGKLIVNNGKQAQSGPITGQDHGDEYVLDWNYNVSEKKHHEKLLLTFTKDNANLARSGTVVIEGERTERNGGMSTLDVLSATACK